MSARCGPLGVWPSRVVWQAMQAWLVNSFSPRLALPLALMARSVATFSPRVAIKF